MGRGPLLLASAALALAVFWGALQGPFVSDDYGYIVANPYTRSLDARSVAQILDPWGHAKLHTANYAPVHLLATALERQIFADAVLGYHLVNVLVHALNAVLLVALLRGSRLPEPWALLGGALFLLHPANVEAVAWVSQLKTCGSLALTLSALLAHRRRPALGALLFGLALLTKASAAAALPMAAAFTWARRGGPGGSRRHWAWLGGWALLLALYAVPQVDSFRHIGGVEVAAFDDVGVHARTIAAVGARYLAMAVSGYGVAAFQEPPPVRSWWDPWWLAALPAGVALGWRAIAALRARAEEGAYWVGAAASFLPVSQLFPFVNPVADRYLYFVLPGLIGGALLCGRALGRRLEVARRGGGARLPPAAALARGGLAVGVALALLFGVHAAQRARLWRHEAFLLHDAATHYPEGGTARFLESRRAAAAGDVAGAVASLRAAERRHAARFSTLLTDPALASLRGQPAFDALLQEMAGRWIERVRERGLRTQAELRVLSLAHQVRREYGPAVATLERALALGGPQDALVRAELAALRPKLAAGDAAAAGGGDHRPSGP